MQKSLQKSEPSTPNCSALDTFLGATKAVADGLRARILRALWQESYAVLELCEIFDMPQPALSHHLKVLSDAGLLAKRREGNSIFYRRNLAEPGTLRTDLLHAIDQIPLSPDAQERVQKVHAVRRQHSEAFFAENAATFEDQQALIAHPNVYTPTVMHLVHTGATPTHCALEVGPGNGELLSELAQTFTHVTGIDSSAQMLAQAQNALVHQHNVTLRQADFSELDAEDAADVVVASMVVHHMSSPQRFFQQAARLTHAGGLLVVVELCPHDQQWVREACGDLWLGFTPEDLQDWATEAGFQPLQAQYLAQKNGFRLQIHGFRQTSVPNPHT